MKSKAEILRVLEDRVIDEGSQVKLARKLGVSRAFLNHVLHGKRAISTTILDYLGYEEVMLYKEKV